MRFSLPVLLSSLSFCFFQCGDIGAHELSLAPHVTVPVKSFKEHTWKTHQDQVMGICNDLLGAQKEAILIHDLERHAQEKTPSFQEIADALVHQRPQAPSEIIVNGIHGHVNTVEAALLTHALLEAYPTTQVIFMGQAIPSLWQSPEHMEYTGYPKTFYGEDTHAVYKHILGAYAENVTYVPLEDGQWDLQRFARTFARIYRSSANQVLVSCNQEGVLKNLAEAGVLLPPQDAAYAEPSRDHFRRYSEFEYLQKGVAPKDIPLHVVVDRALARAANAWRKTN